MADGAARTPWLTVTHALAVLAMLASVGGVIYKVGQVQAQLEVGQVNQERSLASQEKTLREAIAAESTMRQADKEMVKGQLENQSRTLDQVGRDVRELRSYMMVKGQFK